MADDEEAIDHAERFKKLLDDLTDNDSIAQREFWDQFASKITRQARKNLSGVKRRESDEEDVAVDVLNSLFQRLADGRLGKPRSKAELWNLLLGMTNNKSIEEVRAKLAQKRGGGNVRGESAFGDVDGEEVGRGIENAAVDDVDPQRAFEESQTLVELLDSLGDDQLRQIALLKMAGNSVDEIAQQLGCGSRTIQRRLSEMRKLIDDGSD
jgi:RNA polymerase sigma factor (sigma-70 family)